MLGEYAPGAEEKTRAVDNWLASPASSPASIRSSAISSEADRTGLSASGLAAARRVAAVMRSAFSGK